MNNTTKTYDVLIVGSGVAGAFASYKIAKEYKDVSVCVFDIGRKWAKRKSQIVGFLGSMPSGDGKLYQSNINKVSDIVGVRKAKSANTQFNKILSNVGNFNVIKDRLPSVSMQKKLSKAGYDISLNNYMQIIPKDIHALSKYMAGPLEDR